MPNDEPLKRLSDFEAVEVSLVGRPANRRKYLLMKSQEGGMEMDVSVIEEILTNTRAEAEDQLDEIFKAKKVSKDLQEALRGAFRLLDAYREELPDDLLQQLSGLMGAAESPAVPVNDSEKKSAKKEGSKVKKDDLLADVPTEVRPALEALWKDREEAITKAAELEKRLKAEEDARVTKEFVEKAEGFKNIPMDAKELGLLMKSIAEKSPEDIEKIEGLLKSTDELLASGEVFKEIGSSTEGTGGDAWAKIEKMAEALTEKTEGKLSQAQAIDKVLKQNPDLYAEYLKES